MNVLCPENLAEAVAMYAEHPDYLLLAGGSDVVPALQKGRALPGLINIGPLDELRGIEALNGVISIGALTTPTELMESSLIQEHLPIITEACRTFGSRQIRNIATLGGNIGNASPAADLLPLLLVLEAEVEFFGPQGRRTLPATELFEAYKKVAIAPGEIIVSVKIGMEQGWQYYYRKVGRRAALNITVASLAGMCRSDEHGLTQIRLAGASTHSFATRYTNTERALLETQALGPDALKEQLRRDIAPRSGLRGSAEYRLDVTANMILECLHGME